MMHHQMNKGTSEVRADEILTQEITTGEHCLKTHRLQISWAEGDVKDSLAGKKFELIRDVLRAFGSLDPRHFHRPSDYLLSFMPLSNGSDQELNRSEIAGLSRKN